MRITFVLPTVNLSGGIRVAAIYAKALSRRGHTVRVVSPPPGVPRLRRKLKSWLNGDGWPSRTQPQSHLDGSGLDHHVLERWRPVTDADVPDADAVIATWWETAEWVNVLSPRKGTKFYFIQHHELFDYTPHERVKATWRMPLKKITISKWLADIAEHDYGDRDVALIPNSVDTNQFFAPPRGRQRTPTVGLLYSTVDWKGVDVSLEAIRLATERVPELKLIAFGIEERVAHLPLPPKARFILRPEQQSLREIYAACDVWLCGSYTEGFHLPPLEAMACRTPVVSTCVGGPQDIIVQGHNGYLVPVGDSQALSDRLVEVLQLDEQRWRAMSEAAYACATRYTWEDAADRFEAELQKSYERADVEAFS